MSILYKFAKNNDHLNDDENKKTGVHPVLLSRKTYSTEEFVKFLALKTGTQKWEMQRAVDSVIEGIEEILSDGNIVNIKGFGSFHISAKLCKINEPDSGNLRAESLVIKNVIFRACKYLKARIALVGFERYNEKIHKKRKY